MKEKKTSWGGVAGWYDELLNEGGGSYQKQVILPNLLRIVESKQGMHVLDIACGQGFFARAFAERGAEVTACDISPELIDLAKRESTKQISYHVAPADDLKVEKEHFDAAAIVLALQNIENYSGAISQAAEALKKGGRLAIVMNHPAFRIPRSSSWQWDEKTNSQYRRIDAYMSDQTYKIDMTPGEENENKKKFTVSFHRPLQSYVKAISKAGMAVTRLEEWISHKKSQKGPRSAEEDRIRKEIPMFIAIEAIRL